MGMANRGRDTEALSMRSGSGQNVVRHEKGRRIDAPARDLARLRGAQEVGAPDSTVTARRFCDQQEMSLHTATGRSLP